MRFSRLLAVGVAALVLPAAVRAASTPSPVRYIPAEADLLIEVPQPRQAVENAIHFEAVQKLLALPQVKEQFDSTNYRRFLQLVAHFEKELGAPWPELIDKLAGDGIAVGVKIGPDPAPFLVVIQGRDEAFTAKAYKVGIQVIEAEVLRQEAGAKVEKFERDGVEGVKIGDNFLLARCGKVLLISNNEEALKKGVTLVQGKETKSLADNPQIAEAAKLLPPDCVARVWLNMDTVRKAPGAEEFYKTPRDPGLSVLFGSYIDVLGRTPYVAAGLRYDRKEALLTVRMPRGREGAGVEKALHMPIGDGVIGSRPLLEPKGVLYSSSFYWDLNRIWIDREALFGKDAAKAIEEADKNTGRLPLQGIQLSKLLAQSGVYHRVVVVNQPTVPYKTKPKQAIPAFAVITEMRDPDGFSRSAEVALRGAALAGGNQAGLKLAEEDYKGVHIVGYRFSEDKPVPQDTENVRFNFSPCFVRVGDQFVVCSTIELCRELVDMLQEEARSAKQGSTATARQRIYSAGVAEILATFEDNLVTQAILDQAIPAEEARKQVKALLAMLKDVGHLDVEANFLPNEFRYEFRIK